MRAINDLRMTLFKKLEGLYLLQDQGFFVNQIIFRAF